MTTKGQEQLKGVSFSVCNVGILALRGLSYVHVSHPIELPIQDYWEGPLSP